MNMPSEVKQQPDRFVVVIDGAPTYYAMTLPSAEAIKSKYGRGKTASVHEIFYGPALSKTGQS